jgi:F0F1-type ATP synthase assembly protein I
MKSIDSYLILLERIKFTLEQMKIEASSIRASSDQTEKRIVEMEKGLNDNIQKVLNDTNILHSEIKGELSSTKFWLQIIVGGIVVGMLILIIQNFMQKKK